MKFIKMQGAGNDFILIETDEEQRDWAPLVVATCDRHYGIGHDGLLLLMPSKMADCRMRVFNTDGTEAEACGNGIRCLVKYFVENKFSNPTADEITVETLAGVRKAKVYRTGDKVTRVRIGMGAPRFRDTVLPEPIGQGNGKTVDIKSMLVSSLAVDSKKLDLNLVSMGNPHAVYFSSEPVSDFPMSHVGPLVEKNKIFPNGVNFEIARVVNRGRIEARVWEKGVGETLACGSGASAITTAARVHGYIDNKVEIKLPGGILEVEWDGLGEVYLTGPAKQVFTGEWPD